MFRYSHLLLLFLLFILFLHSQHTGNTRGYKNLYSAAEKWYTSPDATETTDSLALVSYQYVIAILDKEKTFNDTLVDSYLKCGILNMSRNNNAKALAYFLGAMSAWHKGIHLPDSLLFGPYLYAGSIQYSFNNLDSAVYYYKKAESISNHYTGLKEPERLYNKLGALYYETGDYRKSIPYYEKALSIVSEKKPVNNDFVINYKSNIASSLVRMESYGPALEIYRDLLKYHLNTDVLLANIGFVYLQQGYYAEALQFLRQIKQNTPQKYNNLTRVFLKTGQYDSAFLYNAKSLGFFLQNSGNIKNTYYGIALKYAGDCKTMKGNINGALRDYQSALIQLVPGFNDTVVAHNPTVFAGLQNFSFLFDVLNAKGAAFKLLHVQEPRQQHRQHALAAYTAALALARHIERTYSSDDARLFLKNKVNPACGEAVLLSLELFNEVKDPKYMSAAFGYAENNKASVLQAGLQQLELSGIAGLPTGLVEEEKKYKSLIAKLTIQASQVRDSISTAAVQKKIQEAELSLSGIQNKLDENPAYYRLKFHTKEISMDSIRRQLANKDEAVLSYYYTGGRLLCFYITPQQSGCSSIALTSNFFADVSGLRKELGSPGIADRKFMHEVTEKLFGVLVAPVAEKIKNIKHLVVIPYNEISYVPFELLKDPKDGSLLLNKFAISYNYSANFLFDEETNKGAAYTVLAMAPFAGKETGTAILPALPSSASEISNLSGKIITGRGATKAQFIALSGQYPVIHLATHAVANDKDPLGSYIEFYGEKKDADSIHRLYEKEIYNLDIKSASLLVLSACETGNGSMVNGEGIISLSRAFSYAGCKSVITSLWKADDAATAFIMKKMHVYLQKGFAKDEALQKAKLDYLSSATIDDRYKSPSYWAHLVLIGNHQPVITPVTKWYIPALIGFLLSGGLILLYKKRKRAH